MVEQQLTWSKVLTAKVKHKEQNKETTVKNVLSLMFRGFPHGRTKVSYFDAWKIDRYLERGGYNAILGTPRDISHEIFVDYHSRLEGILKSLDVLDYNGDSKDFPRGLIALLKEFDIESYCNENFDGDEAEKYYICQELQGDLEDIIVKCEKLYNKLNEEGNEIRERVYGW